MFIFLVHLCGSPKMTLLPLFYVVQVSQGRHFFDSAYMSGTDFVLTGMNYVIGTTDCHLYIKMKCFPLY